MDMNDGALPHLSVEGDAEQLGRTARQEDREQTATRTDPVSTVILRSSTVLSMPPVPSTHGTVRLAVNVASLLIA